MMYPEQVNQSINLYLYIYIYLSIIHIMHVCGGFSCFRFFACVCGTGDRAQAPCMPDKCQNRQISTDKNQINGYQEMRGEGNRKWGVFLG